MKNPYNKINKDMECLKNKNCIPIIIGPTGLVEEMVKME